MHSILSIVASVLNFVVSSDDMRLFKCAEVG